MRISDWSSDVCSSDLHDQRGFIKPSENQVEQDEDDQQRCRHDQFQLVDCPLKVFELARISEDDAWRKPDLFRHRALQVANYRGEVATAHVDIDPGRGTCVLGFADGKSVVQGTSVTVC